MARTIYLNDGSTEYVFAGMTEEDVLRKIIYERLGKDCEELFEEVLAENRQNEDGDDWEKVADGYLTMLQDAVQELTETLYLFDEPRLNKKKLEAQLQSVRDNLNKNI